MYEMQHKNIIYYFSLNTKRLTPDRRYDCIELLNLLLSDR